MKPNFFVSVSYLNSFRLAQFYPLKCNRIFFRSWIFQIFFFRYHAFYPGVTPKILPKCLIIFKFYHFWYRIDAGNYTANTSLKIEFGQRV